MSYRTCTPNSKSKCSYISAPYEFDNVRRLFYKNGKLSVSHNLLCSAKLDVLRRAIASNVIGILKKTSLFHTVPLNKIHFGVLLTQK